MNVKFSGFVIYVKVIIYFLLDIICMTFKLCEFVFRERSLKGVMKKVIQSRQSKMILY